MENNNEQIKEVIKQVTSNNRLFIKRIPIKAKKRFHQIADEEFDGHYGFALKHLIDFHDGIVASPNSILLEQIAILTSEVEKLKNVKVEPETKKTVITAVGGNVIAELEGKK